MFDGWTEQEKEVLAIVGILTGISAGGAFSLAVLARHFQGWLLEVGVLLSGDDLLIQFPWTVGVGIDLPRLIILIGAVIALLLVLIALVVRLRREDQ